MPLLPVDLQILFGQTSQVGRQQGIQREGVPLAQAQQGAEIVRRAEQQDASVNQVRQQEEGVEEVRIRERRRGRRDTGAGRQRRERRGRPSPPKPPPAGGESELTRDPALGRHVDVSG